MMDYKGFKAQIDFDGEAGIFVGEVLNTRDRIIFSGHSVDELQVAMENAIEDYIEMSRDTGGTTDSPFSGQISVRINPQIHRAIAECAAREGVSVNGWISARLREAAGAEPLKL